MGFFDKFFNIFKKKHKEELEKETKIEREILGNEPICALCENPIFPDQRSKKFQDKIFHVKPCWFQLQKEVKKQRWG